MPDLKPGWLERQFKEVDAEIARWPEWMKREAGFMRQKAEFDEKCYELAQYFMAEPAGKWRSEDVNELAELIQQTVEDFMHEDEDDV